MRSVVPRFVISYSLLAYGYALGGALHSLIFVQRMDQAWPYLLLVGFVLFAPILLPIFVAIAMGAMMLGFGSDDALPRVLRGLFLWSLAWFVITAYLNSRLRSSALSNGKES